MRSRDRAGQALGLRHYLETGQGPLMNRRIELSALHRDGHEFPIELTITPLRLGGGLAFSAFVRDITQRRQAEAELAYERDLLKTLLDNLPDAIYFKDLESRFVRVSKSKLQRSYDFCLARHRASHPDDRPENLPIHLASLDQFALYLKGKSDFDFLGEADARFIFREE